MNKIVRVAIMQPYFLPYIGYWQLMNYVDIFVVYDDIEYTKKGWINRNRFLLNGQPETFSLPLKNDSDYLYINQRQLSDTFDVEKVKLIRRLAGAYRKAPHFQQGITLLEEILDSKENNLFRFIFQSVQRIHTFLGLASRLVVSSSLAISHDLKGQDRVIATCKALAATEYINPIGGLELYDRGIFLNHNINLFFQNVKPYCYQQFGNEFVPHLSVLDLLMFLGKPRIEELTKAMDLC